MLRADLHRQELTCRKMSLPGQKQCYKEYRSMKRVLHYSMDGNFGKSIVGGDSESLSGAPSVLESRQACLSHNGDAVHCCQGAAGRPVGWNHLRTQLWPLLLAACGSGWPRHGGLCEWTLTPWSPSPGSIPVAVATLLVSPSTGHVAGKEASDAHKPVLLR